MKVSFSLPFPVCVSLSLDFSFFLSLEMTPPPLPTFSLSLPAPFLWACNHLLYAGTLSSRYGGVGRTDRLEVTQVDTSRVVPLGVVPASATLIVTTMDLDIG